MSILYVIVIVFHASYDGGAGVSTRLIEIDSDRCEKAAQILNYEKRQKHGISKTREVSRAFCL